MRGNERRKVSDRCKHGLGLGTCWLCKGGKPTPQWARGDLMSCGTGIYSQMRSLRRGIYLEHWNLEDVAQLSAGSLS